VSYFTDPTRKHSSITRSDADQKSFYEDQYAPIPPPPPPPAPLRSPQPQRSPTFPHSRTHTHTFKYIYCIRAERQLSAVFQQRWQRTNKREYPTRWRGNSLLYERKKKIEKNNAARACIRWKDIYGKIDRDGSWRLSRWSMTKNNSNDNNAFVLDGELSI